MIDPRRFDTVLSKIIKSEPGIKKVILVDRTGLTIAHVSKFSYVSVDVDGIGAIASAVFMASAEQGLNLTIGGLDIVTSEFDTGKILKIEYSIKTREIPKFSDFDFIDSIEQENNKQTIHLTLDSDLDYCISKILEYILENKVKIRHLNLHKPSLEDIYMKLVEGDIK